MPEASIPLMSGQEALSLFGQHDRILKKLRDTTGVTLFHRNGELHIRGDQEPVDACAKVVNELLLRIRGGESPRPEDVDALLGGRKEDRGEGHADFSVQALRKAVQPRTAGQKEYVEAIRKNDVVFVVGPAGTGKTYLAVAAGIDALRRGEVRKLILARPAVEAGEKLGFLPGDFQAKVNPYLKPLYDALEDFLEPVQMRKHLEQEVFEVVPLAFMRGRTLNNAFIILDEAQNTTIAQMKMFLTRLGQHSKAVITGDVTQVDLPAPRRSGLVHALETLSGVSGIGFAELSLTDIFRHRLVADIVEAYRAAGDEEENGEA